MDSDRGYTYFSNALNYAIQELTNTDYETYMELSVAEIVDISRKLTLIQLGKKPRVGQKSINQLCLLRRLM